MRFNFTAFFLIALVLTSFGTQADERVGATLSNFAYNPATAGELRKVRIEGIGQIEYQRLFEAVGEPGESMDSFAQRLGPALRAYSDATGFEACGALATDGERFGVVVGSSRGHTICVNFHDKVPTGMTSNRQTVHSHTTKPRYRANRNDQLVLGASTRLGQVVRGDHPDLFSEEDFGAPGYMVSSDKVWHQEGKGTVREVGAIN